MKYNVGDKVLIKSIDWWNRNNDNNIVESVRCVECKDWNFISDMKEYCGKILTITEVHKEFNRYEMSEDNKLYSWTDEMIEGLVEEETNDCENCGLARNSIRCLFTDNCPHNKQKTIIEIPEDWVLKDENGDEILTSKIILEKKKKEYPKTFLACCDVLNIGNLIERGVKGYKAELFDTLQKLYICRDAYWKIAGEEMGLGKPWEPSDSDYITGRYCIFVHQGNIICSTPVEDCPFTFPTEEMRDAFKENFDPDIEKCKEFL